MDTATIVQELESTARFMMSLAEAISDKGRPLDHGEKKMVRMAMYSRVQGMLDEAGYFFIAGHTQDIASSMERIQDISVALDRI